MPLLGSASPLKQFRRLNMAVSSSPLQRRFTVAIRSTCVGASFKQDPRYHRLRRPGAVSLRNGIGLYINGVVQRPHPAASKLRVGPGPQQIPDDLGLHILDGGMERGPTVARSVYVSPSLQKRGDQFEIAVEASLS